MESATSPRPGLCIGVQKAMTTWLHAQMHRHPQIAASDPKETDFFSSRFDRGYEWYREQFPKKPGARASFDSSPSYFADPRVTDRLTAWGAAPLVILMLRDPVERAYSQHLHQVARQRIGPVSFSEGWQANPSYHEQGLYKDHLVRWQAAIPKERLLVLIAEDVAADPAPALTTIQAGLGVDPRRAPAERRSASTRSPLLEGSLRRAGAFLRQRGGAALLDRIKASPPGRALVPANRRDVRAIVPPLTPDERARLETHLAPQMQELADLLGRESLPWPTFRAAVGQAGDRGPSSEKNP